MIDHKRRTAYTFLLAGWLVCVGAPSVAPVVAQTIELRPVNNGISRPVDAPMILGAVIVGNQIRVVSGGVNVEVEVIASGWGNLPGNPPLASALATIDAAGYLGANAAPSQPGVNLTPLGWPGTPSQGAFQVTQVCSINGRDCGNGQPACNAGPEGVCVTSTRFILNCCSPTNGVDTSTLNYLYSSYTLGSGAIDPGAGPNPSTYGYLGTVLLQVPGAAATTYTVGLINDETQTNLCPADCTGVPTPNLTPAVIRIVTGSCCTNLGPGGICTDNVTAAQCNALPTTNARVFRAGLTCASPCCSCTSNASCNDANQCTQDICQGCNCVNTPNFNTQTHCCNPINGSTTPLSDNNTCTTDTCDSLTGQVTHTPVGSGPCDDGNSCTLNDNCTGSLCLGTPANAVPCTSDADCTPAFCNLSIGFCGCNDLCPTDPDKNFPGICGCGVPDVGDGDGDGALDCVDACPADPNKSVPGVCGCGVPDVGDADVDGTLDCVDVCPTLDDSIFAPDCVPPIPALGSWGLIVVALALLIGGKLCFGMRRPIAR